MTKLLLGPGSNAPEKAIVPAQTRDMAEPEPARSSIPELPVYSNQGSTPTVSALDQYVNYGSATGLHYVVQTGKDALSAKAPFIIAIQDTSSSMGWDTIAGAVVKGERVQKSHMVRLPDSVRLFQLAFNSRLEVVTPNGHVAASDYSQLTAADLKRLDMGGRLEGGSRISDAFHAAASITMAYRTVGHEGRIGITLTTDGWNRLGSRSKQDAWYSESCARTKESLDNARSMGIALKLQGYVNQEDAGRLRQFCKDIGLRDYEVAIFSYRPEDEKSVFASVTQAGQSQTEFIHKTVGH